eukprot:2554664-Prymnesium_polylepis.1
MPTQANSARGGTISSPTSEISHGCTMPSRSSLLRLLRWSELNSSLACVASPSAAEAEAPPGGRRAAIEGGASRAASRAVDLPISMRARRADAWSSCKARGVAPSDSATSFEAADLRRKCTARKAASVALRAAF